MYSFPLEPYFVTRKLLPIPLPWIKTVRNYFWQVDYHRHILSFLITHRKQILSTCFLSQPFPILLFFLLRCFILLWLNQLNPFIVISHKQVTPPHQCDTNVIRAPTSSKSVCDQPTSVTSCGSQCVKYKIMNLLYDKTASMMLGSHYTSTYIPLTWVVNSNTRYLVHFYHSDKPHIVWSQQMGVE